MQLTFFFIKFDMQNNFGSIESSTSILECVRFFLQVTALCNCNLLQENFLKEIVLHLGHLQFTSTHGLASRRGERF